MRRVPGREGRRHARRAQVRSPRANSAARGPAASHAAILAALLVIPVAIARTLPHGRAADQSPPAQPTQRVVTMDEYYFNPNSLQVEIGDTVLWTNLGGQAHTATSKEQPPIWDSGAVLPGGTFTLTFTAGGHFEYECTNHPDLMEGAIDVAGPTATATAAPPTETTAPTTTHATPTPTAPTASPTATGDPALTSQPAYLPAGLQRGALARRRGA